MRLVLADDLPEVRFALRFLFAQQPDIDVIGEAVTLEELPALIRATAPDVVLLDWQFARGTAADMLPLLCRAAHHPRIVVCSSHPEVEHTALQAGADAFVSKHDTSDVLLSTLRRLEQDACSCHATGRIDQPTNEAFANARLG
jgi:DNA-binding NarL/FixJ family response regulator